MRVALVRIRTTVYAVYHYTPLAGQVGIYKTYWRIAIRYWWPGMFIDMKDVVDKCGHYIVGKNMDLSGQEVLNAL
mgnify:CR=1 FL=1|jgi:hypothetical protein